MWQMIKYIIKERRKIQMDNKYKDDIEYLRKLKDTKDKKNEELKAINTEIEML